MRAFFLVACLATSLATTTSVAQEPRREASRERVAVLLLPTGDLEPTVADGLTELLIGAVASRGGVTIIGREELQAQLGQGDAGMLECIGSMACMGRVGVELGVTELVAGTLAHRADRWVFNLNRVDVRRGEIVGRVFREVEGDLGAVADALAAALPELYAPVARAATLVVRSNVAGAELTVDGVLVGTVAGELREDGIAPGTHALRVMAPGHRPWQRSVRFTEGAEVHLDANLAAAFRESIHPLVWIAGGASVALLAVAIPLGVASQATLEATLEQRSTMAVTRAALLAFYEAREREAIAADVLLGLAGATLAAALFALLVPERHTIDDGELALEPALGGLSLRGALP